MKDFSPQGGNRGALTRDQLEILDMKVLPAARRWLREFPQMAHHAVNTLNHWREPLARRPWPPLSTEGPSMNILTIAGRKGCPVLIRGVLYPSQRAAARALGLCPATISNALDAGRVDEVGLGIRRGGHPGKPCIYRGKAYPSRKAAALACGVSVPAVSKAARSNDDIQRWAA